MKELISKHFGLTEEDVEAQALNEEVTANAATCVNNVPACEGFGIKKDAPIKNKVLKGTFIWHWTAKKINEADDDCRFDVANKVFNMFTGLSAQDSEHINNAEKTETQTREQVIHGILDEMYNRNR